MVRVKCPECRAINRIDEDEIGRNIRCQECDERFRILKEDIIDDDEDRADDRPRRRTKPSGSNVLLIVLLSGGALFLTSICACGFGIYWVLTMDHEPDPIPQGRGRVVLDKRDKLLDSDPRDPQHAAAHMKVHQVQMKEGKTYHIFLNSNSFDPVVRLETPNGQMLAQDDDSGGGLNSLIVHRATQTGMHRVVATSFFGGTGTYHVNVQEAD